MAELLIRGIVQAQKDAIFVPTGAGKRGSDTENEQYRKEKKMARSIVTQQGTASMVWSEARDAVVAAVQRVADYRAYRRTVRELSDLSGRDLADLGLHRSEIRRVAHDSVYGARR
jgi:uncharacterized protein YjiS (DUF1127 family)